MKHIKPSIHSSTAAFVLVLLILSMAITPAFAAKIGGSTTGTGRDAGRAEDSAEVGTVAWQDLQNIEDIYTSTYAKVFLPNGSTSHYLRGDTYNFTEAEIPDGSIINGIQVDIRRYSDGATNSRLKDVGVYLLRNGSIVGQNKAVAGKYWVGAVDDETFGSSIDTWGVTDWTPADIRNAGFGVMLSAINQTGSSRNGYVANMRITVYFDPATTTSVDCGSGNPVVTHGSSISCVATVTRSTGTVTPTGTMSWSTDGAGTFTPSTCTLAGSGAATSCSVSYTPTSVGDGSHLITASYSGSAEYVASSASQTVTFDKLAPTLSVSNTPVTYNGAAQGADVTASFEGDGVPGTVSNVLYNGSPTVPVNAGTYAVTADFTPDSTIYKSLTSTPAGSFVITKADPTLSVANIPVTYNGEPQAADVSGSVLGTVSSIRYNGSTTVPTNAGDYTVTADFTPADTQNYNSLTNAPAGVFVIAKATPTLSVTNSPVIYNGEEHAAAVTGSVPGEVSGILYEGSVVVPTDAGAYGITANFTPTDPVNYHSLTAAPAGTFVIEQAEPNLSVSNSPVTYNGTPQDAQVVGSVPGKVSSVLYNGSAAVPTAAGAYAVTADFTPDSTNYKSLAGAPAGTFVIEKASPTLSVTNSPAAWNGSAQAAVVEGSVPGTVSDILYDGTTEEPAEIGDYQVTASFVPTDRENYNSLTAAPAGLFTITKAKPTLSVTNTPVTYNREAQQAIVVGSVEGTVSHVLYNGNSDTPTNADVYAVTADFSPTDLDHYESITGAPAGIFVIAKADPMLSVTNSPVTYDGNPHAAVVTGSVEGTVGSVFYNGSAAVPTNAGDYMVTASFLPADTNNYNTLIDAAAGTFVIAKAKPTLTVTNSPVTYSGSPQAAVVVGSVEGAVSSIRYNGLDVVPTKAGSYTVKADFAPADANNYESLTGAAAGTFVIDKADPALTISNAEVTYNGSPQSAVVAGSVPGEVSSVLYNGSEQAPTNAGTYKVTATFVPTDADNYNSLTAAPAGSFVIAKANPTLSVTNSPVVYDGQPQAAVVAGSVQGTVSGIKYDGLATAPSGVGNYNVTAYFTPADAENYNSLSAAPAGVFRIGPAPTGLTLEVIANQPTFFAVGNVIHYTYVLTNSGGVPLDGPISVTDDRVIVTCPAVSSLAPSASTTCSGSYTVTLDDVNEQLVRNTATGYAKYAGSEVISNTDEVSIPLLVYRIFVPIIAQNSLMP